MGDAHSRIRRIDTLTPRPRRAHYVNPQVLLFVDVDLNFVSFGQYGDCHRRSMNTTGPLSSRNALDAMNTAFEFKPAVGSAPGNCCNYFLDAAKASRAEAQ